MRPISPVASDQHQSAPSAAGVSSITITIDSPTWLLRGLSMTMAPAMVLIMGIDLRIRGQERILVHGIADEAAHILTAVVMLSVLYSMGWHVRWLAAIAGAVAVDLDHILVSEGVVDAVAATNRGALHTLGPALLAMVAGVVLWPLRAWVWTFGLAMLTHLLRDSATSELPLAWPLSDDQVHLRYSAYITILVACTLVTTGVVALGAQRRAGSGPP